MKELIIKKINFRTCYHFLLLNVAIMIASFVLYPLKIIPQTTLQLASSSLAFFLNLYADLGYIKYSFIQNERRFRQIIIAAIGLSTIQSLLITLDALIKLDPTKYTIYLGVIMLLSTPLFFYAFGLIKNDDVQFFKRLSKLNLYLPIIALLGLLFYLLRLTSFLLFPIILAGFVIIISLWYWQIKLFRHLSVKYKEIVV